MIRIFFTFLVAHANEVILSSGLGGWNRQQLWNQYTSYKAYSDMGILTGASILAYNLQENGMLGVYPINDTDLTAETYQQYLKTHLGLKAYPCVYCDASLGNCQNLSARLENLYLQQEAFLQDSLHRADMYGWDGYSVDFEPDDAVNATKLMDFLIAWGDLLYQSNRTLQVWIGGDTPYDLDRMFNTTGIVFLTMDTYTDTYESFLNIATPLQTSINNISNLGFGLLTNYGQKSSQTMTDIEEIVHWSILTKAGPLSLWASHIPPLWYKPLRRYVEE